MSDIFPSLTIPKGRNGEVHPERVTELLTRRATACWLEVHAEYYKGESAQVTALEKLRATYPLSVHGVGLSLGSAGGLDADHLERLRKVCQRFQPDLVSEHLAWSVADGAYLNDLLPLRYDEQALATVARNIDRLQETLKRRVLVENLSAYIAFANSTMTEAEFLAQLVKRTGCGLLLDVNNVYVSAHNLAFDANEFIAALPAEAIGEIHLAGHAVNQVGDDTVLIDDHGSRVPPAVWALYAQTLREIGSRPTLIEWDTEVPELDVLLGEMMWADMLSASIAFSRRAPDVAATLDSRFVSIVVPFGRRSGHGRIPALAAFEAIRPAAHSHPQKRSYRHAVA